MYARTAVVIGAVLVACPGPEPHLRPGMGGAPGTTSHGAAGSSTGGIGGMEGGGGRGGGALCDANEAEACGVCFRPLEPLTSTLTLGDVLDWDADGDMDIAGLGSGGTLHVLLAEPEGMFGAAMPLPPPIAFGRSGKFTDDELPDSIVFQSGGSLGYRENLGGLLDDIVSVGTVAYPKHLVTGDIDGDGVDDFVVMRCEEANCMTKPIAWPVYIATGTGMMMPFVVPPAAITANPGPEGVLVRLNDDAFADLITLDPDTDELQVFLNTEGALPPTPITVAISPPGVAPHGIFVKDIDGTGGPELAITHLAAGSDVAIMTASTTGTISAHTSVPVDGGQFSPTLIDVDRDGHIDLVVGVDPPGEANQVVVACGNATGFDAPRIVSEDASIAKRMVVEDIDGDGSPDIAVRTLDGIAIIMASP